VTGGSFLLVMADHVLTPSLVRRVLATPLGSGEVCVAIDHNVRELVDPEDATKVDSEGDRLVRIGKDLDAWTGADVGVLLCTHGWFDGLERAAARGAHEVSDGVQELADRGRARAVDVTGDSWIDVDTPESYRAARRSLIASLARPDQDGFVSRSLNRPISVRLSAILASTSVTPNQISVAAFLVALVGAGLLGLGHYAAGVVGGLLVQTSSIIDGCDGEVARLKHLASPRGGWIDTILDRYADLAIVAAVVLARASAIGGLDPWLGGFVAATGFLLASYVTKEFALRHGQPYPNDLWNRLRRRDLRLFGIFCGALVGWAFEAVVALGALAHACTVGILVRGWREAGSISHRAR
jgi:CDP-L-myo-inositol myo-inositolphosphotransferase